MNLDYLSSYLAVIRLGSFSEVAKKLAISQPAVTFQIQKLEQDLGVRLIDRRQKALMLTEAGKRLARFAEIIEQERNSLMQDLDQLRQEVVGSLVIAASTIPGDFIIPPFLSEFKRLHPAVSIQVTVSDSGGVIEGVVNGTYEIGFCGMTLGERELEAFKIAEDEIALIVFPGHPFADKNGIAPLELTGEPLIFREETSGTQHSAELLLSQTGFDLSRCKPALVLGTTESVVSAVEAKLGIAFVSNLAIKKSLALGLVSTVKIKGATLRRNFFCIYRKQRVVSRLLEEFITFTRGRAL